MVDSGHTGLERNSTPKAELDFSAEWNEEDWDRFEGEGRSSWVRRVRYYHFKPYFLFWKGSHYEDQAGLDLPEIYLPLFPRCWDSMDAPPCLEGYHDYLKRRIGEKGR